MKVKIFCKYYPTENVEKIISGILKIFPDAKIEIKEEYLYAETTNLDTFSSLLKKQRIRDTARSVISDGVRDNKAFFRLNKQVMTVGVVNFAVENMPLGDVEVIIEADENEDIYSIIDLISPSTIYEREEENI